MSNTTCPHYPPPSIVPGQPWPCRGCGALVATPNPQSPEKYATYPATKGRADGLTFPLTFPQNGAGLELPGSGGSNAGLIGRLNQQGAALSEV